MTLNMWSLRSPFVAVVPEWKVTYSKDMHIQYSPIGVGGARVLSFPEELQTQRHMSHIRVKP